MNGGRYEYQPVQHCSEQLQQCASEYLFCDRSKWRCRSRVSAGGNCTGFEQHSPDICYRSVCINVSNRSLIDDEKFPK